MYFENVYMIRVLRSRGSHAGEEDPVVSMHMVDTL